MTLSTTVSIVIAALCVTSVSGVAWWLKPVFDKKRAKLLAEEDQDLITAPSDPSHNILMVDETPEKGPNSPIAVSSYEEFEDAGIRKDVEDLQEELKAKSPSGIRRKSPKKTSKKVLREPTAPKVRRPKKKTTIEE